MRDLNFVLKRTLVVIVWFCFFLLFQNLFSQTIFKGVVLDADTGLPLPYVNMGFVNKGLGTVSEEDGSFNFSFDASKLSSSDTLKVSSLAYKDYRLPFLEVQGQGAKPLEIKLEPEVVSLNEVVLSSRKRKRRSKNDKIVGYSYVGQLKNGSWEGDGALGGELVTKINVNKKSRQLKAFYFYVLENTSDSLLIRINVYDGTTKYPEKKITNQNILYTLKTKVGKVGVDLVPYNIVVQNDFSIGIELLKVYGSQIGLILAGDDTPGVSYRRYTSQGEWKRYSKDALTYFVSTTLLDDDEDDTDMDETLVIDYTEEQLLNTMGKNKKQVGGFVFKEGEPIVKAQVQNLMTGEVAFTDEKGRYTIRAKVNDELEFSHLFLEKEKRKVLETSYAINVSLQEKVVNLDGVTVTASSKGKRTQEELLAQYNEDKGIIKTSFGIFDKETSGVSLKILDESDFTSGATTLGNLLRGKVSGLSMLSTDNLDGSTEIYLRQGGTSNPIPAAYEIDGLIVEGFPSFLDVSQIKRIAILSGLSAVAKYGSIGAGGVIIINTKSSASGGNNPKNGAGIGITRTVASEAITEEEARRNWPDFLQELYGSTNFAQAQDIYNTYEPKYGSNPNFNIDAINYFLEFWESETFTERLIEGAFDRFPRDVNYLKALAFVLDKNERFDLSVDLYKRILTQKSNSMESYRDLAHAYVLNKQEEKGMGLYGRCFNLLKEGYFSKPPDALQNVMNSEIKSLLDIPEEKVSFPLGNMMEEERKTRILLEWNDDSAVLDFQFISSDNNVSDWSNERDGEAKESLVSRGYTSKDFFIYGNEESWQINSNYRGNKSGLATYLKITVSTDYGTTNQKNSTMFFRLDVKDVYRELVKIP